MKNDGSAVDGKRETDGWGELHEADAEEHLDALFDLAASASAAHDRFAFRDEAGAARFYRELYARGGADFAPPTGHLFTAHGRPAALFALVPPAVRKRGRLIGALMLARSPQLRDDPALAGRLKLAAGAFVAAGETDGYLSRLAVAPGEAGRGGGRMLLGRAVEETRRLGLTRCVLEVADTNERAMALYHGFGFDVLGSASVTDPESGARLGYVHMGRVV